MKIRRQLKQDRPRFGAKQGQAILHQFKAVDRFLRQPLPVRNEFGSLPGKNKILAGLLAPASHGLLRRRAIEHAVEFGGRKLAGIVLKLVLERQALRKKWPAPGLVVPS